MIRICLKLILIGAILFYYGGCAARITAKNSSPPLSSEKVNWQIISEQQEGFLSGWSSTEGGSRKKIPSRSLLGSYEIIQRFERIFLHRSQPC